MAAAGIFSQSAGLIPLRYRVWQSVSSPKNSSVSTLLCELSPAVAALAVPQQEGITTAVSLVHRSRLAIGAITIAGSLKPMLTRDTSRSRFPI
jgi:hypothetical protein